MCTVTWIQDPDRYSLFCNRDELRSRRASQPPEKHASGGARYLAPTDGEAGGTWIAVNEHAVSLCLLNDYAAGLPDRHEDLTSRGLLVRDLIRAADLAKLGEIWSGIDLTGYRPFKLLALAPNESALLLSWNGTGPNLNHQTVKPPLCSSSFDDPGVARARSELLQELSTGTELEPRKRQLRFHQSHQPERGPYSVCMHRPDAVTVSFTLVEVDPQGVSMAYAHGSPCSTPLEHLAALDRVADES